MAVNPPVVRVENLSHCYGAVTALSAVSLELPAGGRIGLVGPDGVGKSTLLALMAGVRRLQQGRVEVFGDSVADARHRRLMYCRVAYMPQGLGHNLYASLSVYENVDFFGRLFGLSPLQRRARIEELLDGTGLLPFAQRQTGKLSGGMKQKLALCCALIHDPDLLILDEPTTGVDPLSRRQFWELIERIRARSPGMTVIAATAYMEEAERFDWLVMMNAGQVLASEATAQLKARTGAASMEEAFVALLPPARRYAHERPAVAPQRAQASEIAIEARGLTKRFGDFLAVDCVNFAIHRGEIFGFLGSNGCGKTTTMKMLTGLLPIGSGEAQLFGKPLDADDIAIRMRVGFMSQSFSLYTELSVRQNLELHAHLYHLPKAQIQPRIAELTAFMGLGDVLEQRAESLPLGLRQRLSLAVAVIHQPELLILDEPTSGVDPVARDHFWDMLLDLSRRQGVTIFLSTHFMNEATRCDRVSLMEAGRVLAEGAPTELVARYGLDSLEAVFIHCLEEARGLTSAASAQYSHADAALIGGEKSAHIAQASSAAFSWGRLLAYVRRETMELLHDRIRLAFAMFGPLLLLSVMGYGFSMDVEHIAFAVLDGDHSPESRVYIDQFSASSYFSAQAPLLSYEELEQGLRAGDIRLALAIPPEFGKNLRRGRNPEVAVWLDGSLPFRAETMRGYVQKLHRDYLNQLARQGDAPPLPADPIKVEARFRYNQAFKSVYALMPGMLGVMLLVIPAILTAVGVVREKELGSIVNLYATPVTRLEFLLGKQLPYLAVGLVNALCLVLATVYVFDVPMKGSFPAFAVGAVLQVAAATGFGLLISSFARTQIAALFGAFLLTIMPAINFSGLMSPVASLTGGAAVTAITLPGAYFNRVAVGVFTKSLDADNLLSEYAALALLVLAFTGISLLLLKTQED